MQTYLIKKAKCASSQVAHNASAYPCFCCIKRVGLFLVPPPLWNGMLVHRRVTPSTISLVLTFEGKGAL